MQYWLQRNMFDPPARLSCLTSLQLTFGIVAENSNCLFVHFRC
jgi:hypothetical protein